jgi:hypothetical protein
MTAKVIRLDDYRGLHKEEEKQSAPKDDLAAKMERVRVSIERINKLCAELRQPQTTGEGTAP